MAKSGASRRGERTRSRPQSREAYREEFERRRAERLSKALKVAPFDPEKFVRQIRAQSWATIHTVAFVLVLTAVCLFVGRALGSQAWGAFAALLGIGGLYLYLKRVWDIDVLELGKATSMVGVYLTYFVTWVMASFLLSNPPFYDDAAPEIHCCGFYEKAANDSWVFVPGSSVNATNGSARVEFLAFDNAAVTRVTLEVRDPSGSQAPPLELPVTADGVYRYDFTNLVSRTTYVLSITAWDASDHTAIASALMTIA